MGRSLGEERCDAFLEIGAAAQRALAVALEIELLVEAIQVAKYPDRPRAKPALDKFDSLDALRLKVQGPPE